MKICPQCGTEYDDAVAFCNTDGTKLGDLDAFPDAEGGADRVGQVLGAYRLIDVLGYGGMGCVYLAEHTRLGRKVALKLLHPEFASNAAAVRRFFGEARAVNQIKHENLVEITDFIEEEGDEKYYIMELLEGTNLGTLQRHEGILPLRRALDIGIQVCDVLATVHDAGIVHRDLKPENIFLTERAGRKDFVKILDFGVAKLTTGDGSRPMGQTGAGALFGTPEYMSPEQVSSKAVDHRADIYAIGVILYELVTGRKPLSAHTFGEMVIKHLTVEPTKPSKLTDLRYEIPRALEKVILRCLEKDTAKRVQTVREVEQVLTEVRAGVPDDQVDTPPRRRPRFVVPAAAAAVLVIAAVGGWVAMGASGESEVSAAGALAAAVEPAATAQPAAPATVKLTFESSPAGAEVFRRGSDAPLGLTPFTARVEAADAVDTFEFRLGGYDSWAEEVSIREDATLAATLAKVATRPAARNSAATGKKPKKKRNLRKRDTLDPFAE